jgi:hypothetical protein
MIVIAPDLIFRGPLLCLLSNFSAGNAKLRKLQCCIVLCLCTLSGLRTILVGGCSFGKFDDLRTARCRRMSDVCLVCMVCISHFGLFWTLIYISGCHNVAGCGSHNNESRASINERGENGSKQPLIKTLVCMTQESCL